MSERAKSMRTDLRYTNLDQLDRKIGELEYKQATQSLSLAAEKALVKEVGELRKARSKVSEYHSLMEQSNKERDVSRATGRELSEQINVLGNKLKDVNARLNAQWEVMKAHDDQRDERRKGLPGLYKSRDETRASINAAYTELKALKNGFYQARKKYQAFAAKQRKERYEAQKKERADADKAERQERAKAEAEEAALHHPWEREIALCNVIENYLRSNKGLGPVEDFEAHDVKLAAGSSGDAGGEAAGGAGVATVTTSFDKAVKMTRKGQDEDDDEWAMLAASNAKKKGKKGRKAKKEDPAKKKLIHSLESMASFDLLGLAPPTTMKDVDASLTAVQEKRAAYRVAPPREKGKKGKKGGEAAAAPAPAPAAEASTE